jgi:hypothetical protein
MVRNESAPMVLPTVCYANTWNADFGRPPESIKNRSGAVNGGAYQQRLERGLSQADDIFHHPTILRGDQGAGTGMEGRYAGGTSQHRGQANQNSGLNAKAALQGTAYTYRKSVWNIGIGNWAFIRLMENILHPTSVPALMSNLDADSPRRA